MLELTPELEKYIEQHSGQEPEILSGLSRETHLKVLRPRMLSGNLQGQFLRFWTQAIKARTILEIGTYTGYAAISMAMGLEEGGVVHTIENNDEIEDFIRDHIRKSGFENRITLHIGEALDIISGIDETFDLVFIDADKRQYTGYYKQVFDKVRPGGYIIADDVLWDGKVTGQADDPQTRGIMEFNDYVQADERVENILLPVRHGLMLIRKKLTL